MPPRARPDIDPRRIEALIPPHVAALLDTLWRNGRAAYVVGGSLRDALLRRPEADWDVATDARPDRLLEIFPGSHYENRFGTVLVVTPGGQVEVTTFRRDHAYGDHRRPDRVTFTDDLSEDLARRDFTVNAIAWGRRSRSEAAGLVDQGSGIADLEAGLIRAVGDPDRRFDEDALRLVRAARLAAQLGFEVEPETRAAMVRCADLARHVSDERIGQELRKLVCAERPSVGLRILAETGVLERVLPELAAQRGIPQAKGPGQDCWEHTLATVDAAASLAPHDERLALAALLHDAGKPTTFAGGRFHDHEAVGAEIAERLLRRLAVPRIDAQPVVRLVRLHMFDYDSAWSDAAVRRFVQRAGPASVDDLMRLREADSIGSGGKAGGARLAELRARVEAQLALGFPVDVSGLAVDGDDLRRELGLSEGPLIGRILDRLLDSCVADPARNTRRQALLDARAWLPELLAEKES